MTGAAIGRRWRTLNQLSRRCFLFWLSTRRDSSTLSNAFSLPRVSSVPKYTSSGDVVPGWTGTALNFSIVCFVRREPCAGDRLLSAECPVKVLGGCIPA